MGTALMNYRECYRLGMEALKKAGVPEPENDARLLLEYVCHTDRNTLLAHGDMPVEEEKQESYAGMLKKRCERIPLQLLTGEQDFCGFTFEVNEHVLIPRQDTEILVEQALKIVRPGMCLLDMCTGSGCILISLLALQKNLKGVGADISGDALKVAKANAERILPREAQPVWHAGDLFEALEDTEQTFDMIVSNPPYIPSRVIETLMPEVKDFEPRRALDGSEDGLLFYRRIVKEGTPFLVSGGFLLLEIGHDQGEDVKHMLEESGYENVCIKKDYAGLDRVVMGQKGMAQAV